MSIPPAIPSERVPAETLPHHETTGVQVSRRPAQTATPVQPATLPAPAARYRSVAPLGAGGMGHVTLVHDEVIGRDTAIKSLHEGLRDSEEHRARFLREARIQGQLDHPGVVPVYDIQSEGPDAPSFSMRYVRGVLLADVLDQLQRNNPDAHKRYSRRRLLTAFSAVCGAVHFAHARGVIHRDLKPENVMLGEYGEVYVLDWGIARVMDRSAPRLEPDVNDDDFFQLTGPVNASLPGEYRTERGRVVGTPGFIAPEAWVGIGIDARADVYSLGVMLFEILTHTQYHAGTGMQELMRSTFNERIVLPSERRPDLQIPPELDAICETAMAFAADVRYASAGELREAVERFLDGDRDVALRREAADAAAREAAVLTDAALGPDGSDTLRSEAMQRLGRALMLDPQHNGAMQTLVRLLVTPPRTPPPEVKATLHHDWTRRVRALARVGVWSYLACLALLPGLWWLGVRDPQVLAVVALITTGAAAVAWYQATRRTPSDFAGYLMLLLSTLAIASVGVLTSPLLVVPTAVLVNTLVFLAHGDRMNRRAIVATGVAGMFAQLALEALDVLPRTFAIERGTLTLHPVATHLHGAGLLAVVTGTQALALVIASLALAAARASANRELTRLTMLAWNLKQIAPSAARELMEQGDAPRPRA